MKSETCCLAIRRWFVAKSPRRLFHTVKDNRPCVLPRLHGPRINRAQPCTRTQIKCTEVVRACVFKSRPVGWQADGKLSRDQPVDFFHLAQPKRPCVFPPHSHDPNINRKETLPSKKASWNVAFPAQELLHKIYFSECPNGSLHYHQKYYRGTIVGINRSGHDNHSTTPLQISEDRETVALSNWQSPYISYVKLEHTPHVTMHFLCESGM